MREPPTPYTLREVFNPGGVGVSNRAYQRSTSLPVDSVLGRQGRMVLRTLNSIAPAFYLNLQQKRYSDVVSNAAGVNYVPDITMLVDPSNTMKDTGAF